MASETQRVLETLARRFLPFPNGNFSPSPPPALLDKITDELLVVASDAVATVAAEQPRPPSGKSLLRLLAWIVADARGASTVLDKLLAETVGKRLDRQAQKVRTTLARATKVAEFARSDLLTVLADSALASDGADRRAEIDAAEKQAYEHARDEVYIGFHELEALLPGYVAPSRYTLNWYAFTSPQARLLSRQSHRTSRRRLGRLHARRCRCGFKRRVATGVSTRPTATSGGRSTSLPSSTTCGASATQLVCRPARRTRQSISRTPPWSESKQRGSSRLRASRH
jgi:hypothetical protein